MRNKDILDMLSKEIKNQTPDISDRLSLHLPETKGRVIEMTKAKNNKKRNWIIGVSAAAVLALSIGLSSMWYQYYSVDTVIGIDVNPSIELQVNRNDTVLKAVALNDDANVILDDMKLSGVDYNTAINALIGSMLKNGYINDLKNSILISVDNDDAQKRLDLEERLMQEISAILSDSSVEPALMAQSVSSDEQLKNLANQYNISLGKATLIQRICAMDSTKTFESLAKLSVNDLYLLADIQDVEFDDILAQGSPSDSAYITADEAKSAALTHAKVTADSASFTKTEMDFDDGVMVYEIEFVSGNVKYEYDINATDAAVTKYETEQIASNSQNSSNSNNSANNNSSTNNNTASASVTQEQAKNIALQHAGVSNATVTKLEYDRDDNDYDIEFTAGGYKYEYEVNASNGSVKNWEKEAVKTNNNANTNTNTNTSSSASTSITKEQAKSIALQHAGVSNANITKLEFDRDDNDYDIEFTAGNYEYEYEVNASNGNVKSWDKEAVKSASASITQEQAKNIALQHAGISSPSYIKAEFDSDDNKYDVEFKSGNTEYEYEINASNGNIIKWESDKDD